MKVVFERLAVMVEELPVPTSSAAVAELAGVVERAQATLDLGVAALARSGEWALDGDVSLGMWLRRECGWSTKDACARARLVRRLNELPHLFDVYASGGAARWQVVGMVEHLRDDTVGLFAEQESELLPTLLPLDPPALTVAMRHWAAIADDKVRKEQRERPRRTLHLSPGLGGRRELSGSFDPEGGETVNAALRMTSTWDAEDTRTASERLADALVEMARQHLERHDRPRRNRNRPRINVIVDVNDLAHGHLADGSTLDAATTGRLLCDAEVAVARMEGRGVILDYGRATRLVPQGLWDALVVRDRGCRYPGCDRPPDWTEAHHVIPWEDGGPTSIDNLLLACSRHHHVFHLPGWHAKLRPDGTVEVTTATGRHLESRPPPR